jgi:methoxymalonate biosynthesis acyl carrier protein
MSAADSTIKKLREILKRMNVYPGVDKLSEAENLFTAGALDSLVMIQFVLSIEDEFQVRLENDDINYDQFASFSSISTLLTSKYATSKS